MDEDAILAEMLTRQRQKKKSEIHALWPMIRKGINHHVPIRDIYEILTNRQLLSCSYGYFSQTVSRIQNQHAPAHTNKNGREPHSVFSRLVTQPQSPAVPLDTPKEKQHKKQGPLPGTGKGFSLDYDLDDLI